MKIKVKQIIFLILFLSVNFLSGMGLGDWDTYTKNETLFNNPGSGIVITLANGKMYRSPSKWYFYKDHILGVQKVYTEREYDFEYFIINEKEGEIYTFNEEGNWEEFIKSNELKPKYWRRWFKENWKHIELIKILAFFLFPVSIIIIILNMYFYKKLVTFDENWMKWAVLSVITSMLLLIITLLGEFPDSF